MSNEITLKPLLTQQKIQNRIEEIAAEMNHDYAGKEVTLICVLKGSFVFCSDLMRHLTMPLTCEFLGLSSYGNKMSSSGEVKVTLDVTEPLAGRHIVVVEDIVDTGLTLQFIRSMLRARQPASLKICSLLLKPESVKGDVPIDYLGFKIGNEFVVGYGIDYAGKYRGLPYLAYVESGH